MPAVLPASVRAAAPPERRPASPWARVAGWPAAHEGAFLAGGALLMTLGQAAWLWPVHATPTWDEANHLLFAAKDHDLLAGGLPSLAALLRVSPFYPPLYHLLVAAAFGAFGVSADHALVVNALMFAILGASTWLLGRRLFGRTRDATLALGMLMAFPVVGVLARQWLLDLPLTALVAATVAVLASSRFASGRGRVALGLLCAAGLLTKWVFPIFVAGPLAVWAVAEARRPGGRRRVATAVLAVAVFAALLALPWYRANGPAFLAQARVSAAAGAEEGDPVLWSADSNLYYLGIILDIHASAPVRGLLVLAALLSIFESLRRAPAAARGWPSSHAAGLIASWIALPYVVFTCISNKDSRYVAPLLPALALGCAWALGKLPTLVRLVAFALTTAYMIALHATAMPREDFAVEDVSTVRLLQLIAEPFVHDVENLRRPDDRAWPAEDIVADIQGRLTRVSPRASIAVVPDLAWINAATLAWLARQRGFDLEAQHPSRLDAREFRTWEYALVKPDGVQGSAYTAGDALTITWDVLGRGGTFMALREFPTPDGPVRLLRTRHSVPPPDLVPPREGVDLSSPGSLWRLGEGWSAPEPWGRWAVEREAALKVELRRGVTYRVTVEICPPEELVGSQEVGASYAGAQVGHVRLDNATWLWKKWTFELRPRPSGPADEPLRFSFARQLGPEDLWKRVDKRPLAAAFRWIRFEEVAPAPP